MEEQLYPCNYPGCKVMRTKAEGGTTFTVCDEHWDDHIKKFPSGYKVKDRSQVE